eukprot:CAMPEP_0202392444 /NCGR_PEP_ID=MMETSP1127-20130417/92376_1 /ASSEMBLY_ACC=CAM_ASM_000462 /TAXON_ID=3047 /ORGANISM="Dunaliella tertiolecta, Strain CCMP1320" /LENGTH=682 /DNA_ID=CAMNT_0048994951 /DNA_START=66 /DNA_END=2111 /DNA_ORIENTATION=-
MSMKVSAPDGVKVYNVSSSKNVPQWLSESKKREQKKNEEFRRRLELLQDFRFNAACQRIKISPDQQYIFASGYHPPQVKVYDLANFSMKFERHLDSEIVDFQILTEDYSKAAFLCADRSVCLHARFGSYYKLRVPRFGRDIAYAPFMAELLVAGSAPEVYRINMEEGRFMTPLACKSPAVNATGLSPVHGLFACAGEDGVLECFDLRMKSAAGALDAATNCGAPGQELTAVRFDDAGLQVAVGTRNGLVGVYDLRSQRPVVVKDHMYGSKIVDIKFHASPGDAGGNSRRIVSSDRHICKIWDINTGEGYTSIEPTEGDINDVCLWPNSGLLMVGCDASVIQGYFIPSLGPAPKWCSHLEGLTEEMEEAAPSVYDDYRFVTKNDLVKLGLDHLMGTSLLRAYMHGFFVDNRLYNKAKSLTEPFAYETYRQQRIAKKLEEERESRISMVKKLPKVNARMAAKLMAQEAEAAAAAAGDPAAIAALKKKGALPQNGEAAPVPNIMADKRFGAMFEDADFVVDENAEEYRALHPNAGHRAKAKTEEERLLQEHFEQVSEDGQGSSGDSSGGDDDDDSMDEAPARAERPSKKQHKKDGLGVSNGGVSKAAAQQGKPSKGPAMYAAKDAASLQAFKKRESRADTLELPLAERVGRDRSAAGSSNPGTRLGGSREIKFVPHMAPDGVRGR